MPIDLALFDLDGVLIESETEKFNAWNRALVRLDSSPMNPDEYMRLVGIGREAIADYLVAAGIIDRKLREDLLLAREEIYKESMDDSWRIPSTLRHLDALCKTLIKNGSLRAALVTSETAENAEYWTHSLGIVDCIQRVITAADVAYEPSRFKPAPDLYLSALALLDGNPKNTVVFEDTIAGVTAARRAGISYVIAVPNLWTEMQFAPGADHSLEGKLKPTAVVRDLKNGLPIAFYQAPDDILNSLGH